MGGSSSSRKITIDHDEANGVIKISDTVVKRLRGEVTQDAAKTSDATRERPSARSQDQRSRHDDGPPLTIPSASQSWRSSAASHEEMRLQAIRLNQERDAEIKSLEQKWRNKLAMAEEQNLQVQKKMEGEFTTAVDTVEKLFPTKTCDSICLEKLQKVSECYVANQKQPLNCSQDVKEFKNCVQQARLSSLMKG